MLPSFSARSVLTGSRVTGWSGARGMVHEAAKARFDNDFRGRKAYLCGRRKAGFAVAPRGDLDRAQSLMAKGAETQSRLDMLRTAANVLVNQIEAAKALGAGAAALAAVAARPALP